MRNSIDHDYLSFRALDLPTILWIELTSKCPFDCVFCSRKFRHGAGEHMDFGLYIAILDQLRLPEVIRLNYSGESVHYPRLEQAIAAAKATGARVELVTALASASPSVIEGMVRAGLDRITISVHAAEEDAFDAVYHFSSLPALRKSLQLLADLSRVNSGRPEIDFAFVAADRNVRQLPGVAALAERYGVRLIQVQPVAYRDPIPYGFVELDADHRIQNAFKCRLREAIEETRRRAPAIDLLVTDPDADECRPLSACPSAFPAPLPAAAGIFSCSENPWETTHVRANGDVVTCGWRDHDVIGHLASQSMHEIWQGETYYDFRQNYMEGREARCRSCHWKQAYLPGPLLMRLAPSSHAPQQFLGGWYADEPGQPIWSGKSAKLLLGHPGKARMLHVRGHLLAGRQPNRLTITVNRCIASQVNAPSGTKTHFDVLTPISPSTDKALQIEFQTEVTVVPARDFGSKDVRELGFCLYEIAVDEFSRRPRTSRIQERARVPWRLRVLGSCLAGVDAAGKRLPARRRTCAVGSQSLAGGVTVIIPERDNRTVLAECLASLNACREGFPEPIETLVVVNGVAIQEYSELGRLFSWVRWLHSAEPLSFTSAVRLGLNEALYGWAYLLNSDMMLAPDALERLLDYRSPDVFAVGSQIYFRGENRPREESGLVKYRIEDGLVEVFHSTPGDQEVLVPTLFAGGGSSLFQRDLLRRFVGTGDPYNPFYFEDAEWSMKARREGYRVLFCSSSSCWHLHRATVLKFYAAEEVNRLFERHRLKWQLRNWLHPGSRDAALRAIAVADEETCLELTSFREIKSILAGRLDAWCAPRPWSTPPGLAPRSEWQPPSP